MTKVILIAASTLGTLSIISCTTNKLSQSTNMEDKNTVSTSGVITHIENGKDGYTATIKNASSKEYLATISIVNLQKSGSQFKRYKVGDTIKVKGTSWKDEEGKIHITAEKLN